MLHEFVATLSLKVEEAPNQLSTTPDVTRSLPACRQMVTKEVFLVLTAQVTFSILHRCSVALSRDL